MPLSSATTEIDRQYRQRLEALRTRAASLLADQFSELDTADLAAAFEQFVADNVAVLEGSKAAAQLLSVVYLESLAEAAAVPDYEPEPEAPEIAATSKAGSLSEAFGGILGLTLGAIGSGKTVDEAMSYGSGLVSRMADAETLSAADAEIERQSATADQITGWEGIVQSGACATCVETNSGRHSLDEEMWRHGSCGCTRVPIFGTPEGNVEAGVHRLVKDASAAEPGVTNDIVSIGDQTGLKPVGLDFRLKTEGSTLRKITGELEANPNMSLNQVLAEMKDNLRYTYTSDPAAYDAAIRPAVESLLARGYEPVRATNYWRRESGYAGVHTNWRTADGQLFELQFHTVGSLEVKEIISHPLYEAQRLLPEGSAAWDALQRQIDRAWREYRAANRGLGLLDWLAEIFPEVH